MRFLLFCLSIIITFALESIASPIFGAEENCGSTSVKVVGTKAKSTMQRTTEACSNPMLRGGAELVCAGTHLPIIMDSPINSSIAVEGDEFTALTVSNVLVAGVNVVPAGSAIKGSIAIIEPPKLTSTKCKKCVGIRFDTISTPSGKRTALRAVIVASDGIISVSRGSKNVQFQTVNLPDTICESNGIGAVVGRGRNRESRTKLKHMMRWGTLFGMSIGDFGRATFLCVRLRKPVVVQSGDRVSIELSEDLRMPK